LKKFRGVFVKLQKSRISYDYRIIFLMKTLGLIKQKVIFILISIVHARSNGSGLSPQFGRRQWEQSNLGAMVAGGEGAQARAMGHRARQSFYLCDLEEQGVSFYSLSVKKMIHGGVVAAAWSSWSSMAVHDLDWASPASRSSLKLHLDLLKLLFGSIASDGGELSSRGSYLRALGFGACGTKFDEYGPLFIGLSVPTSRGCEVLHFLSMNRTLIRLRLEDFWMGMNFPAGLTWVKENTLSGIGSPG
jgi:hypothetical protein